MGKRRSTLSSEQRTLAALEAFPLKAAGQKLPGGRAFSSLWANLLFSLVITICQSLVRKDSPSPEILDALHVSVSERELGATMCSKLVKISCQVIQGLTSHHMFGESLGALNWGLGCEGTKAWSVKSLLSLEPRMGPCFLMP